MHLFFSVQICPKAPQVYLKVRVLASIGGYFNTQNTSLTVTVTMLREYVDSSVSI